MKAHTQVNRDVSGHRLTTTSLEKCFPSKPFEPRFIPIGNGMRNAGTAMATNAASHTPVSAYDGKVTL